MARVRAGVGLRTCEERASRTEGGNVSRSPPCVVGTAVSAALYFTPPVRSSCADEEVASAVQQTNQNTYTNAQSPQPNRQTDTITKTEKTHRRHTLVDLHPDVH